MKPLRAVLAGCGAMGSHQAQILKAHDDFELVGVCDVDAARAQAIATEVGATAYTDFAEMLATEQPETVSVTTGNSAHAALVLPAAAAVGVRGIYCEKPMATNMGDARKMVDACKANDVTLIVNHQRRLGTDLIRMRELIESGAIGEIELIRGDCGGDILSDVTHMVDSVMWLCGDRDVESVFGAVHREITDQVRERASKQGGEPGYRHGHPTETGAMAIVQIKDGPRIEFFSGDMRMPYRHYQYYQAFGRGGSLLRTGDQTTPNLFISNREGGPLALGLTEDYKFMPLPVESGKGMWRAVDGTGHDPGLIAEGYARFAASVRTGAPHPMCAENALRGFEVVMSIYESARLRKNITFPLEQDRFPLEIMMEENAI